MRHVLTGPPGRVIPADGTDADLIERSRRDPGCFATIFDRHAGEILRYARARLGPELAEDVTAETFLAAFRHRDRYDTAHPDARPWLYGIAVRQIGRHRRAQGRRLTALRATPPELVTEDFGPRAVERVTAEQLRPQLGAVLAALPRQDRELLLLVAWAGLSYEESAQALGLTVGAVKSRSRPRPPRPSRSRRPPDPSGTWASSSRRPGWSSTTPTARSRSP